MVGLAVYIWGEKRPKKGTWGNTNVQIGGKKGSEICVGSERMLRRIPTEECQIPQKNVNLSTSSLWATEQAGEELQRLESR
jgi:hypothetical protein